MEVYAEKDSRNRGMGGSTSGKRARPGVKSDLPLANRQQNRVIQRSRYEPLNNIKENNEENNGESFLAGYIDRKTRRQRRREDHIILQITIEIDGVAIETGAMIDSGVTANFIDKRFCQENQLPMQQKPQAQPVYLIDGSDMESGPITHQTNIRIHAANHTEEITFEETTLGGFPIILGLP